MKLFFFNPFSKKIKNRFNAIFPLVNYFIDSKTEPIEKLIFKVRGCNMSFGAPISKLTAMTNSLPLGEEKTQKLLLIKGVI
jgi:hypothetical protein